MKISVVIPLGTADFSTYDRNLRMRQALDENTELILVSDGCSAEVHEVIASASKNLRARLIRSAPPGSAFSSSRARNAGIEAASNPWIIQEDADLLYADGFYNKIRRELRRLGETPFNFLTVPTIYLTSSMSEKIVNGGLDMYVDDILTALAFEDVRSNAKNYVVQSYAPASGVLIHSREEALKIGGYDADFDGWGGEDRDFAYRLLLNNTKLPRPDQFEFTAPWNLNDTVAFQGWRSLYRLVGDYLSLKGIYAFHLFHPKNEWKDERATVNLARAAAKAHQLYLQEPPPTNWDEMTEWGANLQGSILFDRYRHHSYIAKSGMMQIGETSLNYKARQWRTAESKNAESQAFDYGCIYFHQGDFAGALENFLVAARLAPKSTKYLRCAAEAQRRLGRRQAAANTLQQAAEVDPKSSAIKKRLTELRRPAISRLFRKEHPFAIPLTGSS